MVQFFSSSSQIITPPSRTSIQTIRRPRHSQETQNLDQQIPQPTSFSQKALPIISCSFKFIQPSKSMENCKQSSSTWQRQHPPRLHSTLGWSKKTFSLVLIS